MLPLNPARAPAEYKRALALQQAGRLEEARAVYAGILAVVPKSPEVHFNMGRIAQRLGRPDDAVRHLTAARALKPAEPAILAALSESLLAAGRGEEALATYESLIQKAPKDVRYRIDKAFLLQRLGDFDAAEKELRKALKQAPMRGDLYRLLAANRKFKPGDPLIGQMEKAYRDKRLTGGQRVQLGFALAKAMEDTAQTDRVFSYLTPANAEMKAAYRYDIAARRAEVDGLIRAFEGYDFTAAAGGPDDFAPIFVTGLPRSGTTLVEQILASHSQITGAGELPHAVRLAYGVLGKRGGGFRAMADVSADDIARLGCAYRDTLRRIVNFDRVVTDKSIQSHMVMGLLKQAIPSARFIVVRRDPRDMLFSIYKNMFAEGTHRYAYDLADLAGYYACFLKILEFWRSVFPGGFHEVHYEDLVADPEGQSRALVAAAGVPWEDSCLSFHEARGEVRTLSVSQVRQPIYRSSAQAWRKYEKELAPLIEALDREGVLPDGA
ncbi:tetratricopeptide repeat-containing sulfotransferase family protein [Tropicimonas isoalkanivorans]|uniref:Tetratricopeptide repeat-containing protein n=1 Tax=Tropicimonas isoalkanivorans TaxID=441112 RepID=A0A1I1KUL3_9RHOB|nr:sulfotransferase [Tropicimonas isoalkanivorans]SFC64431.1 Tetratricopeptide repeat-containing protein [Tropicimonas isoalkanivorans]